MSQQHVNSPAHPPASEPESLADLVGDCRRMSPHWTAHAPTPSAHTPPSDIHGVRVPPESAHLLDAMSDYGD